MGRILGIQQEYGGSVQTLFSDGNSGMEDRFYG